MDAPQALDPLRFGRQAKRVHEVQHDLDPGAALRAGEPRAPTVTASAV
jgi:hypothetical protein